MKDLTLETARHLVKLLRDPEEDYPELKEDCAKTLAVLTNWIAQLLPNLEDPKLVIPDFVFTQCDGHGALYVTGEQVEDLISVAIHSITNTDQINQPYLVYHAFEDGLPNQHIISWLPGDSDREKKLLQDLCTRAVSGVAGMSLYYQLVRHDILSIASLDRTTDSELLTIPSIGIRRIAALRAASMDV